MAVIFFVEALTINGLYVLTVLVGGYPLSDSWTRLRTIMLMRNMHDVAI